MIRTSTARRKGAYLLFICAAALIASRVHSSGPFVPFAILGGSVLSATEPMALYTVRIETSARVTSTRRPAGVDRLDGLCSGVLLPGNRILTAAHCMDPVMVYSTCEGTRRAEWHLNVEYDRVDVIFKTDPQSEVTVGAQLAAIHGRYDRNFGPFDSRSGPDLAVLRLNGSAPNGRIPALLAAVDDDDHEGQPVKIAGFGGARETSGSCPAPAVAPGRARAELRSVDLTWRGALPRFRTVFCLGNGACDGSSVGPSTPSAWYGDSGGPAAWADEPSKVIGIISAVEGGATLVTDLRPYRAWIDGVR